MEPNEIRLIALVNLLTDAFYPNPDDPGPVGPWGPWIREALKEGPLPDPWRRRAAASADDDDWWWQGPRPFPPYKALAELAGHFDNELDSSGGTPRPNWRIGALLSDLASLNPQPLPPIDGGIGFARMLALVALRRAQEAGGEQGGSLLRRFSEDWCGNSIKIPALSKPVPGEPRPPRPEESLVLGAALIRAASSSEVATLQKAAKDAGQAIFKHGLSALA